MRTYNYTYDRANRITAANYTASGETNWYSVSGMTYDANGNISAMTRRNERTPGTYDVVDQLTYSYQTNSNKLTQVTDGLSAQSYTAKDFKERSSIAYTYDANGNLKTNLDKQISNISYNHLNLPSEVVFNTGARIRFGYNAEGVKLTQQVFNTSNVLTTTQEYVGEFVYQNGALDFLIHEEGRVASEPTGLFYEYYLKDHLGNVRQVLRNSTANFRIATMEQANAEEEESTFTQIKPTRKREPKHNVTKGGQEVAWLNAGQGEMVGPGTTQEIYAGDSVTLSVHGKFLDKKKARVNEASFATIGGKTALLDQLNELALNSKMAGGPNPIAVLNLVDIVAKDLQKKETPEAYLIYALYDEDSNRYEVGKKVLTRNAANQHEELEEKIAIKKNGYIETFVVNETSQDVWFDNFKILSQGSILVQETHYDPWGLELTGIGYEYAGVKKNRYLYNGKELIEDAGLQYYDYGARMYDPAIGRWGVVDPLAESYYSLTPYQYGGNTPVNTIDIGGELFVFVNGFMPNHWFAGVAPVFSLNNGIPTYSQNNYYNPNREFFNNSPRNGIDSFEYWEGVDVAYMDAYGDDNAYYTNGSFTPKSTASSRFNAGVNAGQDLIARLESGDISLGNGETIKIVGHSQGAAYAAGIVSALIKHERYGGLVEFVDYLSPHQPGQFKHPSSVNGRQFSTKSDKVSSVGLIPNLFGKSKYNKIDGTTWGKQRENYEGGLGGHMVDTWLDDLVQYWKGLGIPVSVIE